MQLLNGVKEEGGKEEERKEGRKRLGYLKSLFFPFSCPLVRLAPNAPPTTDLAWLPPLHFETTLPSSSPFLSPRVSSRNVENWVLFFKMLL